ncbi:MAG: hypothetical protein ACXWT1_12390 [Methylobacter sp.]
MIDGQTQSYLIGKSAVKPGKIIFVHENRQPASLGGKKTYDFSKRYETLARHPKSEWLNQQLFRGLTAVFRLKVTLAYRTG